MTAQTLRGVEIGVDGVHHRDRSVVAHEVELSGRVCTVRASDDLATFAEVWPRSDRMGEARCHIFQCADLIEVWIDTIGKARRTRPVFVGVFDEERRPMMLFPLGIERRWGSRELRFLDGGVSDYNQPVLFPAAAALDATAWQRLWPVIVRAIPRFELAVFEKVPEEVAGLPNPFGHLGGAPIEQAGYALALPPTREALEERLPLRKVRGRLLRQLSARGPVSLKVAETEAEAAEILQAVLANKSRQYEKTGVRGFEHPGMRAFYEAATARLARPATVHLSALTCGEAIVACHCGLILGDRFYLLLTAYAQEWKHFSPGALLHNALIRWSQERGLTLFDFGVGNEPYKAAYCDTRIPLHELAIPNGPAGRAHLAASRLLGRLRATSLWQWLRPIKWMVFRRLRRG